MDVKNQGSSRTNRKIKTDQTLREQDHSKFGRRSEKQEKYNSIIIVPVVGNFKKNFK